MARRRAKNRRGRDRPIKDAPERGFLRRYATQIGIALSVLALVAGVIALWPAFVSNQVLQNPILQIAGLTVTTKKDVASIDHGLNGEEYKSRLDVAAVSIALRNSGEEPALINRVRVNVDRAWIPRSCGGGGPGYTTVAYDFALPGDVDSARKPVVLEKEIQFKVDGKSLDFLAITVGQEAIGEAGWSWITGARVELVQDNRETLRTEPFVVMDGNRVDGIVQDAAYQVSNNPDGDGFYSRECMGDNMRMLEEAIAAPGVKSAVIGEFHDRLGRLGFQATGAPATSPNSVPGDDASDTWIAQLASLPRSTSAADVERNRAKIATETGLDVRVLDSSDFASLVPGYWVIYHPGRFADGHRALEKCRQVGRTSEQSCSGRYLSHVEQHRNLVCRFSDTPDTPHCSRN
jgi:hypothetical protein